MIGGRRHSTPGRRRPARAIGRPIAGLVLLLALGACGRADAPGAPTPPARESTAEEGPVRVRSWLERDALPTPEDLTLRVESEVAPGTIGEVGIASLEAGDALGGFTVLAHRASEPRLLDSGRVRTRRTLVLEPFLPGEYEVPPIELAYRSSGGSTGVVRTEALPVRVESVLDEQAGMELGERRPLAKLPEPERFPWNALALSVAGVVGLVLAGLGGMWWLDRRRRVGSVFDGALARIESLRNDPPGDEAACRAAWDECGRLLIDCIGERLEPEAHHLTGSEIAARARDWFGLPDPDRERLRRVLERMELVRFGGEAATPENTASMLGELAELLWRVRDASDMVVPEHAGSGGP